MSAYKPYPKYKDSGVRWLGRVPEHWKLRELKTFTSFCGGGTPSRDNPNYWGGDIPWVSPKDMKSERIRDVEECITSAGLDSSSTSIIPVGQVLMVVRSGILKHTIPVAINEVPVALNQDMKSMHFEPKSCTSAFFFRWVSGLNDSLLLAWAKQGATVESIEHSYLAETLVALPPLPEQTAIATYLDRETAKIDTLIEAQRRMIDLLKEKRSALISHAVTKGLNPDAPMKESGVPWLGKVPEHWKVLPLRRISQICTHRTTSRLFPVGLEHIESWSGRLIEGEAEFEGEGTAFHRGDILFGKLRPYLAKAWLADRSGEAVGDFHVIRPRAPNVAAFLQRFLLSREAISLIDGSTYGAKMPRARWEFIGGLAVPIPNPCEQTAIATFLHRETAKIDALIAKTEKAIGLAQERRSALISAAVTGKIDLREAT